MSEPSDERSPCAETVVRAVVRWFFPWWPEFRRRWPAILGILRGHTVIYQAVIGPPHQAMVTFPRPHGVLMDTTVTGGNVGVCVHIDGYPATD